ncbi:MAG: purine-nucleoside phosphorylase [Oscillospiraceae bacterium]
MSNIYYEKVLRCTEQVRAKIDGFEPRIALVLGSGLGPLAKAMDVKVSVPYSEIDGMPVSTAPGHAGRFLFGHIAGVPVVCMQGRLHYYEGYDIHDVVLPTRIMAMLGAKTLFLTNAAGGVDPTWEPPTLMVISDHVLYSVPNPLIGPNIDELGTRFPDVSHLYTPALRELLLRKGREMGLPMEEGIYAQFSGPSYETPAEVRILGRLGVGAVGMSTAVEALAAGHMGMKVCGISCITNKGAGLTQKPLNHIEIVEMGEIIGERFSALVAAVLPEIDAL